MVVTVGTPFTVSMIRITRYDGNWTDSHSFGDFCRRLRRLAYRGQSKSDQRDSQFIKLGYKEITFYLNIGDEIHPISFKEGGAITWKSLGFEPIKEGLAKSGRTSRFTLGTSPVRAADLRSLIPRMLTEHVGLRIKTHQRSVSGPMGKTYLACLDLDITKKGVFNGKIFLEIDEGLGKTYRKFYDLEGGNRPEGRGDHVGAFGGLDW